MRQDHPAGTICIPCGELGRFSNFSMSLACLRYPFGTEVAMGQGLKITKNLNLITRDMVGDWLWIMGDDHIFHPDMLLHLLEREVDVVVPLCIRRKPPFAPVIFKERNDDGEYLAYHYNEIPDGGLLDVVAAGTAGMLIRKPVLDAIGDPWFETRGDNQNEDLVFCEKVLEAGFDIWCDTDERLGHISTFTIWPERQNGVLGFLLDFGKSPGGEQTSIFVRSDEREPDAPAHTPVPLDLVEHR